MLKKTHRLSRSQFSQYFKSGKRFHFDHCTIIYSPAPTFLSSVVVSKKVAKGAVRRNTLKRRLYAALSLLQQEQDFTGVFIVVVKPSYNTLTRTAANEFFTASIAAVRKST